MAQTIDTASFHGIGYDTPSGRLIDFHTHILPNMDDGSHSVDESLRMIDASVKQGVCCIVFTPHFYARDDTPERFKKRRQSSFAALKEKLTTAFPVLMVGAEVQYFEGITDMEELSELRIGNSKLLLLEMPHCKWSSRMIDDIIKLNNSGDYIVVLAHIERYLNGQKSDTISMLVNEGVLIQSNANFFTGQFSRRKALHMLSEGQIHLIGSDCHNMSTRQPNLGEAYTVIRDKLGDDTFKNITELGYQMLMRKVRKVPHSSGEDLV